MPTSTSVEGAEGEMAKLAVREPAASVTGAGTVAIAGCVLDRPTPVPPGGAGWLKVTIPVACVPPTPLGESTSPDEIVGCPAVGLTVNVRAADQALRFPARSAVRTRQKKVICARPPEFPTLGGITTLVAGIAPRYRMKSFGKSERLETWNS